MTLNFQEQFRKGPHAKRWHDASGEDWFQSGVTQALTLFSARLPFAGDMNQAAANNFRMEGVREFVRVLLNLTEEPEPSQAPVLAQNLNWTDKPLKNLCQNPLP